MVFQKNGGVYTVRLNVGEEILTALERLCVQERIRFAHVSAIGAADRAVVGLYNVAEQKYYKNTFVQPMELVSLLGNVSEKDGGPYIHLHASFADGSGRVIGGHLNEAVVSATCEMFVTVLDGEMGRRTCPQTGLNIFDI